ncbi:MAG: dTDP-4-dehydrorhamnose 3,5-epimerase [Dehalococcoidia bacterium]|nr:dTDP-4-dehydrorhamnose 3,5-epimerase [Dehalococcoidia bacterium]
MIDGVEITPLRKIPDERGYVMQMLRADSPAFRGIGEVYFSAVYPSVVKGWHRHLTNTLSYTAIKGMVKVVLYDERPKSPTHGELLELFVGDQDYKLVTVPPGVWNGFKGMSAPEAIVAVCMTNPYDPAEIERLDPFANQIPYKWDLKHG